MATKVCVELQDSNGGEPAPSARFYSQTVGDGTTLNHTVTHGFGTSDVLVSVRNTSTGELDAAPVSVNASDPDRVTLAFETAPATGGARVTVLAAPAA